MSSSQQPLREAFQSLLTIEKGWARTDASWTMSGSTVDTSYGERRLRARLCDDGRAAPAEVLPTTVLTSLLWEKAGFLLVTRERARKSPPEPQHAPHVVKWIFRDQSVTTHIGTNCICVATSQNSHVMATQAKESCKEPSMCGERVAVCLLSLDCVTGRCWPSRRCQFVRFHRCVCCDE